MTTVLAVLVTAAVLVIVGMTAYMIRRNRGLPARALVHYDPDAADKSGSTARHGIPQDPFGLIVYREMEAD